MKPLFGEFKQKILSTTLVTVGAFLGFEALSYIIGKTYQLNSYARVSVYIYLFHFFWLTFIFDLHYKKRGVLENLSLTHSGFNLLRKAFIERVSHVFNWSYFRHYLNFLILPGIIYWAMVVLMSLDPFNEAFKQTFIVFSTACLGVCYWYFKEVFSKNFEVHHFGAKLLSLAKLGAAYLFYASIIGFTFYYGYDAKFLFLMVAVVTYMLIYQALFQRKLVDRALMLNIIFISLVMGLVSFWIFKVWNHHYLTAGLIMLAVYNTCWGILHHFLDKNLTKRLAIEYLFILFLALSILLASHDFTPRIS